MSQVQEHPLASWATEGYDGPQPWDHRALGILAQRDELLNERSPGASNDVSPTISHQHPILASGSAHPVVHELGRKLSELGHPNSVSRGENPFGAVDESIMTAVAAFCSQYGVQEDPSGFGGNTPAGRLLAAAHIGPWTIEGILTAHEHR